MSTELAGKTVVVTRPAHQADELCALVEAAGGEALRFPLLRIDGPEDPEAATEALRRLGDYDLWVFVSPNAVQWTLDLLGPEGLPSGPHLATIGGGSNRLLRERTGRGADLCPDGPYDSEALLDLPTLQEVASWRVLILRGSGGREHLAQTLRERGARVDYLEVYRRLPPEGDPRTLGTRLCAGSIDVLGVTSSESLRNLYEMLNEQERHALRRAALVVVSERTAALARELGLTRVRVAAQASDPALLEAFVASVHTDAADSRTSE